jgi:hypothetical protein
MSPYLRIPGYAAQSLLGSVCRKLVYNFDTVMFSASPSLLQVAKIVR